MDFWFKFSPSDIPIFAFLGYSQHDYYTYCTIILLYPLTYQKKLRPLSLSSHSWLLSILFVPLVSLDFALLLQFCPTLLSYVSNCSGHLGPTMNTNKNKTKQKSAQLNNLDIYWIAVQNHYNCDKQNYSSNISQRISSLITRVSFPLPKRRGFNHHMAAPMFFSG